MKLEVYTDGSATTKDKPGGWAYAIVIEGVLQNHGSGNIQNATNNDAELEAAIQGLVTAYRMVRSSKDFTVELCSDSQIVLGWATGRYRFKQESKREKFRQLKALVQRMDVKTRWVEGHAGHEFNEFCDKLAREERNKAMGITKKPRRDSKKLKAACEKMREVLEYVLRETLQMKADGVYRRDDFEDYCEDALNFYKEQING